MFSGRTGRGNGTDPVGRFLEPQKVRIQRLREFGYRTLASRQAEDISELSSARRYVSRLEREDSRYILARDNVEAHLGSSLEPCACGWNTAWGIVTRRTAVGRRFTRSCPYYSSYPEGAPRASRPLIGWTGRETCGRTWWTIHEDRRGRRDWRVVGCKQGEVSALIGEINVEVRPMVLISSLSVQGWSYVCWMRGMREERKARMLIWNLQ
ncbi:hypothetical protein C8Q73DRAFT_56114 [Cubamyces lactineus]|nr:hypothetical protein C8Q73DRAFT_56114 [Cubamyces lactineus]